MPCTIIAIRGKISTKGIMIFFCLNMEEDVVHHVYIYIHQYKRELTVYHPTRESFGINKSMSHKNEKNCITLYNIAFILSFFFLFWSYLLACFCLFFLLYLAKKKEVKLHYSVMKYTLESKCNDTQAYIKMVAV